MRIVVARRIGRNGAGLGNELIPWAKGFIASEVLDATLYGPAWGINRRKYYRNFGTSRLDVVLEEVLRRLPNHVYTEQDYDSIGVVDFGRSIELWAQRKGLTKKSSFIVVVDGMYGGPPAYGSAKPFMMAKLLGSRDALKNVYQIASRLDPRKLFVAVHMRFGGDFVSHEETANVRGKSNFRLPPVWYLRACESLSAALGDQVQFHFFTDIGGPEYEEAVRRFNPGQIRQTGLTECSDPILMTQADLRVCSVSSYSVTSCYLSEGLYLWYEPQLTYEGDLYTPWKMNSGDVVRDRQVAEHHGVMNAVPREEMMEMISGWPVGMDGKVPEGVLALLRRKLLYKRASGHFQQYGAVPDRAL